jgi:hypothetical protein
MADLLSDQHIDARLEACLRSLGHTVTSVRKWTGKTGCDWPDEQILIHATAHKMAVLTCNSADFCAAASNMPWHAGLVIVPNEHDYPALAKLAKRIHEEIKSRSLAGQIVNLRVAKKAAPKARKKRGG